MEPVVSMRNSKSVEQAALNSPAVARGGEAALATSPSYLSWRTRSSASMADGPDAPSRSNSAKRSRSWIRVEVAKAELGRCMAAASRARKLTRRDKVGAVGDAEGSSGWECGVAGEVRVVDEDDEGWECGVRVVDEDDEGRWVSEARSIASATD